jgi:uncharacterized protein (DUF433 family)
MDTSQSARPNEEWRTGPVYSITQAAWLADVSPTTVRRWLFGYVQPGRKMRRVFDKREDDNRYLSFLEMAEIVVAARFRRRGITLERVRRARTYAADMWAVEYPFATLDMKTYGVHIVSEFQQKEPGEPLLVFDAHGQLTLPGLVAESLENFDWLDRWASRWFPMGKSVPIVVDPQMAAGRPTILDTGITVDTVMRRFTKGKQTPTFIAEDYELEEEEVLDIIRYAAENRHLLAA